MSLAKPEIDPKVLEACRQGDRGAFRVVYEAYKDRIYSVALYFFHGDAALAADVTQQVFLKLMTDFHRFRGDSAFPTWLYRIAVNTCVDAGRSRKNRGADTDPAVWDLLAAPGSQEHDTAQREVEQSLRNAVSTLPPAFRAAILLRYFDDLSYEEMAKVLNCSIGTVSSRLSRGHRLLAEKLAPLKLWPRKKDS